MNIRTKVISLLALLFLVLIGIDITVQKQILLPSFAELEREDAKTSMKRISNALDMTLDGLRLTAADWGNWADVYRFVQVPNDVFVLTNITPSAMKQLQVDALFIVDLEGRLVVSNAVDMDSGERLDLDFASRAKLPADFPWRVAEGRTAKGLIGTNRGVMMIAAAPVLNGSGSGRPMGMVIMGRLLTPPQISRIGSRAQAALSMEALDSSSSWQQIDESDDLVEVSRPFTDIYGKPVMRLRVDLPRRITARGQVAVTYASAYLIGAAVVVLILLMVVLNRVVLEPLGRVTRHAVEIGKGSDLTARLNSPGKDEIALLAGEFDRMVARVAETRRELVDQSFQAGFAELAKGVLHNMGNAMTPLCVRLATLGERLRDAPAADLNLAWNQLAAAQPGSAAYADLQEFLRLGCLEMASVIEHSQSDTALIQRQANIVQTAFTELMRSTRNDHVIESVRLPELVSQTLEIVPDAYRQRLQVEADESLVQVGVVRVARTVLRLILQNLIINAADAVRDAGCDKGVLHVAAQIVRDGKCEQLHLQCRDNGVGIPRQDLERVFERGFSTKSRDTNYGIGLHWCANAISALGGRIWAASDGPGHGASMHVVLPLAAREAG